MRLREKKESFKPILSSDWSLQFDSMKLESLVTVNQLVTVNTFSGFVLTARQLRRVDSTRRPRISGGHGKVND